MVDPIGTCQALDLLTQDQLNQLFDDSNGYLSKVDEIFDVVQIAEMQKNDENNASDPGGGGTEDKDEEDDGGTNKKKPKRKSHKRTNSVITDKKCLILDVDNTLIYVRHFMDEMRVGDIVKLGEREATVIKLTYRLDLEFSENPGQMSAYDHVLQSKDDSIPQRGEWFPDEMSKVAIIHQADPTGCVIKLIEDENENDSDNQQTSNGHNKDENENVDTSDDDDDGKGQEVEISFLQNSDELSQLEPMMNRDNYLSVTFMYGGYLVRMRPGLGQFLSLCNAKYDVILFTAADGSVYQGLLKQVHHILKAELEEQKTNNEIDFIVPNKLWQTVYFRADCDEKYDEYGLPYRHKNLAKLGRELSTIVMVDDNPLSYRGFEPNSVRVAGFWGLSQPPDNELMQTLFPTLWTIADHKDVRYHLSGLGQPPPEVQASSPLDVVSKTDGSDDEEDLLNRQRRHSRQASQKFLQHLKEAIVAENESLEGSATDDDNEQSSPPIEQTPEDNSDQDTDDDSQDDNASVDSISNNEYEEIERRATVDERQQNGNGDGDNKVSTTMKKEKSDSDPNPFADNFDDIAEKVVRRYSMQRDSQSNDNDSSGVDILGIDPIQNPENMEQGDNETQTQNNGNTKQQLTNNELDDIFDTNTNDREQDHINNQKTIANNSSNREKHDRQTSDSGIGNAGTLIFDNYDETTLYRDAYESPQVEPTVPEEMLQKRPSIELDLDDENVNGANENTTKPNTKQNSSRGTAPNSPNDDNDDISPSTKDLLARDSYDEDEDEDEEENGTDYILTPKQEKNISGSATNSSRRGVDTELLNKNGPYDDDSKDKDPTISDTSKHNDGFIEMGVIGAGSRPSRTPTPIDDDDAEILIEKSSGCSCFGWFGSGKKKKKKKNIGLAHQDGLR